MRSTTRRKTNGNAWVSFEDGLLTRFDGSSEMKILSDDKTTAARYRSVSKTLIERSVETAPDTGASPKK